MALDAVQGAEAATAPAKPTANLPRPAPPAAAAGAGGATAGGAATATSGGADDAATVDAGPAGSRMAGADGRLAPGRAAWARPDLAVPTAWAAALVVAAVVTWLVHPGSGGGVGSADGAGLTAGLLRDARSAAGGRPAVDALEVGALVLIARAAAGALAAVLPTRWAAYAGPLLLLGLPALTAVRTGLADQGVPLLVTALVLTAFRGPPADDSEREATARGIALGAAVAALPATVLLLVLTARARRVAGTTLLTAAALTAAGLVAYPGLSAHWWTHGVTSAGVIGAAPDNQSLAGLLLDAGLGRGLLPAVWLPVGLAVGVAAVRRAHRYRLDGQPLLALAVVGCLVALVEPVTPAAGLLWLGLATAGRLGHRVEDRDVWPLVALVPVLLPPSVLDPGADPVSSFALRNCPGLLALAVAVAVPFRLRTDPLWSLPRRVALPREHRWRLPDRLVGLGRPNLVLELIIIQVGYGFYTWIRNEVPDEKGPAVDHAVRILDVERFLHIDIEHSLNRFAVAADGLEDWFEQYYRTLHFAVPLAVLVWLYWRHPGRYRAARTAFFACTGLALVGFWGFPLAPPRLTPGHGFDDLIRHGGSGGEFGALTKLANQYAAMPSLHIGWSTWCALVIVTTAPYLWVKMLGAVYPFVTLFVILATANHWVLDAVGGLVCLAAGCVLQQVVTGRPFPARAGPPAVAAPTGSDRPAAAGRSD